MHQDITQKNTQSEITLHPHAHTAQNKQKLFWRGDVYSAHSDVQYASICAAIDAHPWQHCNPYQNVLDIGCGDGKISAQIASRLPLGHVLGIDSSASMIGHSNEHHAPKRSNLTFAIADAQALPDQYHQKFDTITSFYCLHWIEHLEQTLQGIQKCLKPNGQLIFYIGGSDEIPVLTVLEKLLESENSETIGKFVWYRSADEIKNMALRCNFVIERCESFSYAYTYPNIEELVRWVNTLPYGCELESALRQEYIRTAVMQYARRFPAHADGRITLHFPLIRFYGRKA